MSFHHVEARIGKLGRPVFLIELNTCCLVPWPVNFDQTELLQCLPMSRPVREMPASIIPRGENAQFADHIISDFFSLHDSFFRG